MQHKKGDEFVKLKQKYGLTSDNGRSAEMQEKQDSKTVGVTCGRNWFEKDFMDERFCHIPTIVKEEPYSKTKRALYN